MPSVLTKASRLICVVLIIVYIVYYQPVHIPKKDECFCLETCIQHDFPCCSLFIREISYQSTENMKEKQQYSTVAEGLPLGVQASEFQQPFIAGD
jgi:hypothetical protein